MINHTPKKWLKLSLIIFVVTLAQVYPQAQKINYKILGISVVGNKSADAATIIANTGLRIGDEISIPGDQTNNAIKRLWNLGIFQDAQINIEKKIDDGVFLQIKIQEYPRLEKIELIGNDELSEETIAKKINIVRGQTLKPQEISRLISKVKTLYDDEGYLNAVITPEFYTFLQADTTDNKVEITWRNQKDFSKEYKTSYDIEKNSSINSVGKIKDRTVVLLNFNEGDEVTINDIKFNGNLAFEDDDLVSEFDETKEPRWWKFWTSANFKKSDFEKDKELLTKFYRKNGYRDFVVLGDTVVFSADKKNIDLIINVYEGNQYKVRDIIWEGQSVYPVEELNARLAFKKGDVFDYEKFNQNLHYNEKQTDVSSLYQDTGYLGFQLDAKEEKAAPDSIDLRIKV
ncbi:MAG: POTRA domain-containing protein, partial [Melioribacteraceae bacterium]